MSIQNLSAEDINRRVIDVISQRRKDAGEGVLRIAIAGYCAGNSYSREPAEFVRKIEQNPTLAELSALTLEAARKGFSERYKCALAMALATAVLAGSDRIINHESAVVHALDKMSETHIIALLVIAQEERKVTKGFFKVRQIGLERVRTPSHSREDLYAKVKGVCGEAAVSVIGNLASCGALTSSINVRTHTRSNYDNGISDVSTSVGETWLVTTFGYELLKYLGYEIPLNPVPLPWEANQD